MSNVINFEDWSILKDRKPDECFSYESGENNIKIRFSGIKYTAVEFIKKSSETKGGLMYKISYKYETENSQVKLVFGWKDESGKVLVKGYAGNNEIITAPFNAFEFELGVLASSYEKGECFVSEIKVECVGCYTPKKVKLATIALDYPSCELPVSCEYNLSETLKTIDEACINHSPDLLVLTETFYTRKTMIPIKKCSLPEDSEPVKLIREKAKKYNTYIVFSFHETENNEYYNTGFLIGRKGEIEGKYHKTHLTLSEYEAEMTPGRELKFFDTDIGRIAIPICWDLFFPGFAMQMTKNKVDIICHPTAGYKESRMMQRAKECGAYLVVSTVYGYESSAIYGPDGERIADASMYQGYGIAEVDMNKPTYTYWQSYPADTDGKNIYRNEARWDLY